MLVQNRACNLAGEGVSWVGFAKHGIMSGVAHQRMVEKVVCIAVFHGLGLRYATGKCREAMHLWFCSVAMKEKSGIWTHTHMDPGQGQQMEGGHHRGPGCVALRRT